MLIIAWLVTFALGDNGRSLWAEDPANGAGNLLECALDPYTSGLLKDWRLPVGFDAEGAAERVAAEPDVWTRGSLVEDKVSRASSSGSFFLRVVLIIFGQIVSGAILMMTLVGTWPLGLAVVFDLFLVLYSLSKGLSFGCCFCSSSCGCRSLWC